MTAHAHAIGTFERLPAQDTHHAPSIAAPAHADQSDESPLNSPLARVMKVVLSTIGIMAAAAILVASIVLDGPLVLLGACLAFAMMVFIGLPLFLATIIDAGAGH